MLRHYQNNINLNYMINLMMIIYYIKVKIFNLILFLLKDLLYRPFKRNFKEY